MQSDHILIMILKSIKYKYKMSKIPRNIILFDSLNSSKYTHVTCGLVEEDENDKELCNNYAKMEYWNCTLIHEKGNETNIYEIRCRCTKNFPDEKPILIFSQESMLENKIAKICDKEGNLKKEINDKIKWNDGMLLGDYLMGLYIFL